MHQSDFVAQQETMKFAIKLAILVIFWQFCDAKEVTKNLKKQLKELKSKYASIQLSMGMYIPETDGSGPLCITDLFQNKYYLLLAYFNLKQNKISNKFFLTIKKEKEN